MKTTILFLVLFGWFWTFVDYTINMIQLPKKHSGTTTDMIQIPKR